MESRPTSSLVVVLAFLAGVVLLAVPRYLLQTKPKSRPWIILFIVLAILIGVAVLSILRYLFHGPE